MPGGGDSEPQDWDVPQRASRMGRGLVLRSRLHRRFGIHDARHGATSMTRSILRDAILIVVLVTLFLVATITGYGGAPL